MYVGRQGLLTNTFSSKISRLKYFDFGTYHFNVMFCRVICALLDINLQLLAAKLHVIFGKREDALKRLVHLDIW
jgi:hypothetical protein